jgi:hypothetical protein
VASSRSFSELTRSPHYYLHTVLLTLSAANSSLLCLKFTLFFSFCSSSWSESALCSFPAVQCLLIIGLGAAALRSPFHSVNLSASLSRQVFTEEHVHSLIGVGDISQTLTAPLRSSQLRPHYHYYWMSLRCERKFERHR